MYRRGGGKERYCMFKAISLKFCYKPKNNININCQWHLWRMTSKNRYFHFWPLNLALMSREIQRHHGKAWWWKQKNKILNLKNRFQNKFWALVCKTENEDEISLQTCLRIFKKKYTFSHDWSFSKVVCKPRLKKITWSGSRIGRRCISLTSIHT